MGVLVAEDEEKVESFHLLFANLRPLERCVMKKLTTFKSKEEDKTSRE